MICPNCGTNNEEGSITCINCGNFVKVNEQPVVNQEVQPVIEQNTQPVINQNIQQVNNQTNVNAGALNYVSYIINSLLKPFKNFKEEESKLSDTKNSIILSSIVAVSMMLFTLIRNMIETVITKKFDLDTYKYKTAIEFSNLKNLKWGTLIFRNLLMFAGIILAFTVVYYLAGLVFKKSINFIKTLSITATSFLPFVVLGLVAAPIFNLIWTPLAIVALIAGIMYSLIIFICLINDTICFENGDMSIYFHSICLSILFSAGCYMIYKIIINSISSSISNLLS